MDKQSKQIVTIVGVIVIIAIGYYHVYLPEIQSSSLVVIVETTDNVGVVDSTSIVCPVGYTVISTTGGTPDQEQKPRCKAPNPSIEIFDCGDSVVDAKGMVHTIECTTTP